MVSLDACPFEESIAERDYYAVREDDVVATVYTCDGGRLPRDYGARCQSGEL